jgi:hypothetical protein
MWAAHWLADGYDGESLVHLAGLHGDNPFDVRDALPGALADCNTLASGTSAQCVTAILVTGHRKRIRESRDSGDRR